VQTFQHLAFVLRLAGFMSISSVGRMAAGSQQCCRPCSAVWGWRHMPLAGRPLSIPSCAGFARCGTL